MIALLGPHGYTLQTMAMLARGATFIQYFSDKYKDKDSRFTHKTCQSDVFFIKIAKALKVMNEEQCLDAWQRALYNKFVNNDSRDVAQLGRVQQWGC